jgi:hypothetical protein
VEDTAVDDRMPPAGEYEIRYGPEKYVRIVTSAAGHSRLSSEGMKCGPDEPYAAEYNAGIDAIEHFLLALWARGVDVTAPPFPAALDAAAMVLAEQFPS